MADESPDVVKNEKREEEKKEMSKGGKGKRVWETIRVMESIKEKERLRNSLLIIAFLYVLIIIP